MVETRSRKAPISEVKKPKTTDEEVVKATPSKIPREAVEIPDDQSEEPKTPGKKKSKKKNAEDVESDEKNSGNAEIDKKNVDKLEAVVDTGEEMIAADINLENLASMEEKDDKLQGEDVNGLKLKSEENNGEDLTADTINGEDFKTEQQNLTALVADQRNGEDLKNEQEDTEGLNMEQQKSTYEQDDVATEPKTATSDRKSAKKAKHYSKSAEKANSEEVSIKKLNEEQKQLDIVVEEDKQLDNADGNIKQLGEVEVEQKGLEEKEIVEPNVLVKTGVEEENVEQLEGEDKQIDAVEASIPNETPSKKSKRKRSSRLEPEQEYPEKVEIEMQGLQKEQGGEKMISGLEPINAEAVEGRTEQQFTVEMNTDNGKPLTKKLRNTRMFFQRLKEKKLLREEKKMKIDQGISEIDNVEMGQDCTKENSHIEESKQENEKKRRRKRRNRNREKKEGENKISRGRQKVNGIKGAEFKGMEGETNVKKKKTTHTKKEINNVVEINPVNGKPMRKKKKKVPMCKKLKKARLFFRRSRELRLLYGLPETYKVESKGVEEKKRGKKRKNQNRKKEEGANKSSGEGQKVNGKKGAESKGMEGETNAKKKQTTFTNMEINNFVEMNTDNGKPISKKKQRSRMFVQRCKEKKLLRDAEKMKIDQGISEIDNVEMGQDGAKENSHTVESKWEKVKKRGKKRKNQNRETEEVADKSSNILESKQGNEKKRRKKRNNQNRATEGGANKSSHIVELESKREDEKKRDKKRNNQNSETEGGANYLYQ